MLQNLTFCSLLARCRIPCVCHAKRHPNVQKWSEPPEFFPLLTWKCASRHKGVHFFDISISKSVPNMVCFAHFDLEMCFAPQPRALFQHLIISAKKIKSPALDQALEQPGPTPAHSCTGRAKNLNFQKCSEHGMLCAF